MTAREERAPEATHASGGDEGFQGEVALDTEDDLGRQFGHAVHGRLCQVLHVDKHPQPGKQRMTDLSSSASGS